MRARISLERYTISICRRGQGFAREMGLSSKVFPTDVIVKGLRDSPVGPFFTRHAHDYLLCPDHHMILLPGSPQSQP